MSSTGTSTTMWTPDSRSRPASEIRKRAESAMLRPLPVLALALVAPLFGAEGLIELNDPLDEPEKYCVDVPGFGRRLNLNAPLMAHTCKPGAADELFTPGQPGEGQLYMQAYGRCAEAESTKPGAAIYMRECSSSNLQRFSFESDGRIKLADGSTCMTVADGEGEPTGGPSHLRLDLTMESCGKADPARSTWTVPASK